MGNLWLKIKIWTKSIVFGALLLYILLFFYNNSGQDVTFWYWFGHQHQTSMLVLVLFTFLAGVLGTIIVRTTFKTMRQIRDMREKGRLEKLEREHAEMKAKAAMLQTKTAPTPAAKPSEQSRTNGNAQ